VVTIPRRSKPGCASAGPRGSLRRRPRRGRGALVWRPSLSLVSGSHRRFPNRGGAGASATAHRRRRFRAVRARLRPSPPAIRSVVVADVETPRPLAS
jgi:hypothetical protein